MKLSLLIVWAFKIFDFIWIFMNFFNPIIMSIIRIIFAIILPPVGVFLTVGIKGAFWLNILLTILGYIPGIVHAIWIIAKKS